MDLVRLFDLKYMTITKTLLIYMIFLLACGCGCVDDDSSGDTETKTVTKVITVPTSSGGGLITVEPIPEEDLEDGASADEETENIPQINFLSFDTNSIVEVFSGNSAIFEFTTSVKDGASASVSLFTAPESLACDESNSASWSEVSKSISSPYEYVFDVTGNKFFCFVVSDGEGITRKRLPSIFSVLDTDGLVLWLKSDDGVTEENGKVSAWQDQSGLGNHASQTDPAKRPELIVDSDGYSGISYDGSSYFIDPVNYDARSVIMVVAPNFSTNNSLLGQVWGLLSRGRARRL